MSLWNALLERLSKIVGEDDRINRLHRRVQKDEGDIARAKLAETRTGWQRDIQRTRTAHGVRVGRLLGRIRGIRDLLKFYGANHTYVRSDGSVGWHAYECAMIADLAAQRDKALAENRRLRLASAELREAAGAYMESADVTHVEDAPGRHCGGCVVEGNLNVAILDYDAALLDAR